MNGPPKSERTPSLERRAAELANHSSRRVSARIGEILSPIHSRAVPREPYLDYLIYRNREPNQATILILDNRRRDVPRNIDQSRPHCAPRVRSISLDGSPRSTREDDAIACARATPARERREGEKRVVIDNRIAEREFNSRASWRRAGRFRRSLPPRAA